MILAADQTSDAIVARQPTPQLPRELSKSTYKAWLVDFDGTLYWQFPVRIAMAAELALAGPQKINLIRHFRRQQEILRLDPYSFSTNCYQCQLEQTAAATGNSIDAVVQVIQEWMERRPCKWVRLFARRRLLQEIAEFRAAGGRTALVSDYPVCTKLAGLGVSHYFDLTIACGEPGGPQALKPSPEGYLLAASRLGVSPGQCLIIGDREDTDGEAARRAEIAFRLVRSASPLSLQRWLRRTDE